MSKTIQIGERRIGGEEPAFIIAEASTNHNGDLGRARQMVRAAKETGADCIKFQTFSAEEFCADRTKTFTYRSQGQEVTEVEFDMFRRLEFSESEWIDLIQCCDDEGILFLTTVQDPVNLAMLQTMGLKGIKVGSDDFDHLPNLRIFAGTGLPMIISKGMSDLGEVDRVLGALRPLTDQLAVLHCVSLYPTDPAFLNLRQIPRLVSLYPHVVWGFSDHSQGTLASTLAVSLGAKIIEKHFTLDHDLPGPDHWFSMDVEKMSRLVRDIRLAEAAMGSGDIVPATGEHESKKIMRRRIVAKTDLPAGTVLSDENIAYKRATSGGFVVDWDILRGHALIRPKAKNEGVDLADIDPGS